MFDRLSAKPGSVIRPSLSARRAFTLVELIVVLVIVAILAALLLPATRSARPAARRMQCQNNLRQIALALHAYADTYGTLPPASTTDADGKPLHSWRTLILPFLEHKALYDSIDLTKPWNDPANAQVFKTSIAVYQCPSADLAPNFTTYLALVGDDHCFLSTKPRKLSEITDNKSTTLMVVETDAPQAVPWMAPRDANDDLVRKMGHDTGLPHEGGWQAAFADGHVAFFSAKLSAEVLDAMMTIAGNDDAVVESK